jgi:hypothetical protein
MKEKICPLGCVVLWYHFSFAKEQNLATLKALC